MGNRLPELFIRKLAKQKLTVALAESMTCGLAMHRLVKVKGTLQVLKGGIICYNEEVKTGLLKIPPAVIRKHTAESTEVTRRLARSLQNLIKADIHASITGLAAPGGSETKNKPVGTVFFSLIFRKQHFSQKKIFQGSPHQIQSKACNELYSFILRSLKLSK